MRALLASLNEHARYSRRRSPVDVRCVASLASLRREDVADVVVIDLDMGESDDDARGIVEGLKRRDATTLVYIAGIHLPTERRVMFTPQIDGAFEGCDWPERVFVPASEKSISTLEILIEGKRQMYPPEGNRHSKRPVAF
jgi:hypothetical protein